MKVYIILEDWASDYESGNNIEVYDTKEKALEDFNDRIKNARVDMNYDYNENEQIEDSDMVEEKEDDYYCIYEDGYYTRNHITIRLEVKEVK